MTIYIKELKQSFKSLCIWTASIGFMVLACVLLFPQMKSEMDSVSSIFANMGSFTAALGMDKLNFGKIMGFYGIECGNMLSIGGGFFAALTGISVIAKEEKEHTAEFLLTHPVSRFSVVMQKLLSVMTQVIILNIVVVIISLISFEAIEEDPEMKEFFLMHIAYLIMQLEISCICFAISAFIKRGSIGIGIGLSLAFYCMNIVCNLSKQAEFLRYLTPYAYAEASNIISDAKLDMGLIALGTVVSVVCVCVSCFRYIKKDIAA